MTQPGSTNSSYTMQIVKEDDKEEVMRLLKRTFYLDEPLNEALGICMSENDPCPDLDNYIEAAIPEGYSVKAVNEEGKIVGVFVSGVELVQSNEEQLFETAANCTNSQLKKIFLYILARRERGARLWEKFPDEKQLLDVKVAGVDHSWRKRGIMKAMMIETEKIARQKGFNLIRIDASSAYTAKCAESLGYTLAYKVPYTDIKVDGQPVVVPKPPHLYDSVYVKRIAQQTS